MLRLPAMWFWLAWQVRVVGGTAGARAGQLPTRRVCASTITWPLAKVPRRRRLTEPAGRAVVASWLSRWAVVLRGTEPERRLLGPPSSRRLSPGHKSSSRPSRRLRTGPAPATSVEARGPALLRAAGALEPVQKLLTNGVPTSGSRADDARQPPGLFPPQVAGRPYSSRGAAYTSSVTGPGGKVTTLTSPVATISSASSRSERFVL